MKRLSMILMCGVFALSVPAVAQTAALAAAQSNDQAPVQGHQAHTQASVRASAPSSVSAQSRRTNAGLASGTAFNAALNALLDANQAKPGDPVTAHTTEGVTSDGKTVLPKGTELVGHVTQASARAQGDSESSLAIIFDRALLRNGAEVPLNVAIQALASAQTPASAPDAELDALGSAGTSAAGSDTASNRGPLTAATSPAGSRVGTLANTSAAVGRAGVGTLNSPVNSTTGVAGAARGAVGGLDAAGQLPSNSRGVFGLNGLSLSSNAANTTRGALITSAGKNVHLAGGARMLIVTQAAASATHTP
jgi:hypothetical protein